MAAESKKYITSDELKTHNKTGDLWISIEGKVYDVSEWSKIHPGGETPLLNLAGQDATNAFVAYHPGTTWQYLHKFFNGFHLKDYSVSETSKDYRKLVYEFSKMGLFEKKGHVTFITMCVIVFLFATSVYGVIFCDGVLLHLLCGGLIGIMWTQCGWIGHDSGHHQVMSTRKMNRLAQLLSTNCLAGISIEWWKWYHNAHHIACNSLDYDPDLQLMPFFVVSSKFFNSITSAFYGRKMNFNSVARFLVSKQHWTFYPVMCIARTFFLQHSIILLFSSRKLVARRGEELFGVLIFWIWYPLLVSFLPNWGERLMFILASFSVTGIQNVQFSLNHFSSDVYIGPPKGSDWFEKQTSGTLNIECVSWMDWFHGGLQFQVEHHLFPRMPRSQLRNVSPFVRELCKKHNLQYNIASFWEAMARTMRTLKNAALQARDLSSPVPKNLVWEAVNNLG